MEAGMKLTEELRQAHVQFDVCSGSIEEKHLDDLMNAVYKAMQNVTARKVLRFVPEVLERGLGGYDPENEIVQDCTDLWLERQPAIHRRLVKLEDWGVRGYFEVTMPIKGVSKGGPNV